MTYQEIQELINEKIRADIKENEENLSSSDNMPVFEDKRLILEIKLVNPETDEIIAKNSSRDNEIAEQIFFQILRKKKEMEKEVYCYCGRNYLLKDEEKHFLTFHQAEEITF
jgi:Mg2+ and Co2+ transporter CorA